MSDFAKTVHLPAIRGILAAFSATSLNSSIVNRSLEACCSRKDPVPAAHRAFIEKSFTRSGAFPFPVCSNMISFESSPPISMMLPVAGCKRPIALDTATISFTKGAPMSEANILAPVPVVAINSISYPLIARSIASFATTYGFPLCRIYSDFTIVPFSFRIAVLMLTEPMSIPSLNISFYPLNNYRGWILCECCDKYNTKTLYQQ